MIKRLIPFLILGCLGGWAMAASTWYVDAAQTGTDHAGTQGDPYSEVDANTPSGLSSQWQHGDTLLFKGQFYNMDLPAQAYGDDVNGYTVWGAWPGFTPEANDIDALGTTGEMYWEINGWRIDRGWKYEDGSDAFTRNHAITLGGAHRVRVINCEISTAKNPNAALVGGDWYPYYGPGFGGVEAAGVGSYQGTNPDYVTISGCTFHEGTTGVRIGGDFWLVDNCTFYDLGGDGVLFNTGDGSIVQDSTFSDCNHFKNFFYWPGTATGDWSAVDYSPAKCYSGVTLKMVGIVVAEPGANILVFGTDADYPPDRSATGWVWKLDSDPDNVYFTISGTGNSQHGDLIQFINNGTTENPLIARRNTLGETIGQQMIMTGGTDNCYIFENNICVRADSAYGLTAFNWLLQSLSSGTYSVINNICIAKDADTRGVRANFNTLHMRNNIISGGYSDNINLDGDYNIWLDAEGDVPTYMRGANDQYGVNPTDIFTNYAGGDYTLKVGSPAIDAGTNDPNGGTIPTADILGVGRPQNAIYDIGPYEKSSGAAAVYYLIGGI